MLFLQIKALLPFFSLLCLAQVSHGWATQSAGSSDPGCKAYTKLLPRNREYKEHCEAEAGPSGSDPKWPCFTMWYSDLNSVNATVDGTTTDPDDFFFVKDGDKLDFTTKDPKQRFTMSWYNSVSMSYSDHDASTGCYNITLQRTSKDRYRIWVSDENDHDPRDIDTLHHEWTSKKLCSKWLHIHVKEDGEGSDI